MPGLSFACQALVWVAGERIKNDSGVQVKWPWENSYASKHPWGYPALLLDIFVHGHSMADPSTKHMPFLLALQSHVRTTVICSQTGRTHRNGS